MEQGLPSARLLGGGAPKEFYSSGLKASILDILSIPLGPEELRAGLRRMSQAWITAFTKIATESGLDAVDTRSRAEEALIRIEVSLIVARTVGNGTAFERALKLLPDVLSLT